MLPIQFYTNGANFYVNIAVRANGEVLGFDRFNKIDYPLARKRTVGFCQRFDAYLLLDSTGVGEPVFDDLKLEYRRVYGYKLTNTTKGALVENLSIMLDENRIHFLGDPEKKEFSTVLHQDFGVLQSELESFGYERLPSGLTRYSAPEGLHDDTVIALALAAWQIKTSHPKQGLVEFGSQLQ